MQSICLATLKEALCILHGLEKCHHHCFAREVSKIMDHKPLVAIFKKRHNDPITADPVHPPQNTSICGQTTVQARARNFHCRLAVLIESQGKQR